MLKLDRPQRHLTMAECALFPKRVALKESAHATMYKARLTEFQDRTGKLIIHSELSSLYEITLAILLPLFRSTEGADKVSKVAILESPGSGD